MKKCCKVCKGTFANNEVYITENGEYVCKSCQKDNNFELADMELLKRIGSKDCREE